MELKRERRRDLRKGDIIICELIGVGSMQQGEKICMVVSNNANNEHSPCITVVPFTSKDKNDLPTHTLIGSEYLYKKTTALAECVTTIDTSMVVDRIGRATPMDIMRVDVSLMIQLGINFVRMLKNYYADIEVK